MKNVGTWLASTPLGSAAKTFAAVLVAAAVADFSSSGSVSLSGWQPWVIAGLVSALPPIINWLNPADRRYGRTALSD